MDKIPDAEYKVVEHQIAPPLDPSSRWRFQRLARGTGSGLDDASYAELPQSCSPHLGTLDFFSNRNQCCIVILSLSLTTERIIGCHAVATLNLHIVSNAE